MHHDRWAKTALFGAVLKGEDMSLIKGQTEYRKWRRGEALTRKEAMLAQCFLCNGQEQSRNVDCKGQVSCPLYKYFPYERA